MATRRTGQLVQRKAETVSSTRTVTEDLDRDQELPNDDEEEIDSKETRLTLMEEVLLLGLKDREVHKCSSFIS